MAIYEIHTKSGQSFTVNLSGFNVGDHLVKLFDETYAEIETHLPTSVVAAIVPVAQQRVDDKMASFTTRKFDVYLKSREQPIVVYAHSFEIDPPPLKFYWKQSLGLTKFTPTHIDEVYVATSDLIAIIPFALPEQSSDDAR